MAAFGKSIVNNLSDDVKRVELDTAYEGVCSDEIDDDNADDLIDLISGVMESTDYAPDDDELYEDGDEEDDDIDSDESQDDDYEDIVNGPDDEEMEDIMDDSLESCFAELDSALESLADTSDTEIDSLDTSLAALESLNAELESDSSKFNDNSLITDDDINSEDEDDDDDTSFNSNPNDEYHFSTDGTQHEVDTAGEVGEDADDDLSDIIDDG